MPQSQDVFRATPGFGVPPGEFRPGIGRVSDMKYQRRTIFTWPFSGLRTASLLAVLACGVCLVNTAQAASAWNPKAKQAVRALVAGLAPFGDIGKQARSLLDKTPDYDKKTGTFTVTEGRLSLIALRNAPAYNAALLVTGRFPIARKDGMWARAAGIDLRNAIFFYGHRALNRRLLPVADLPPVLRIYFGRA